MQDEVNTKVVALAIRTGSNTARVTASVLRAAMRQYLSSHNQKKQQLAAQKAAQKAAKSVPRGKQTVAQLMDNLLLAAFPGNHVYTPDHHPSSAYNYSKTPLRSSMAVFTVY